MTKGFITFEARIGRLRWGLARDLYKQAIFKGDEIEMHEGRGFFSRAFIFKSSDEQAIMRLHEAFKLRSQ